MQGRSCRESFSSPSQIAHAIVFLSTLAASLRIPPRCPIVASKLDSASLPRLGEGAAYEVLSGCDFHPAFTVIQRWISGSGRKVTPIKHDSGD